MYLYAQWIQPVRALWLQKWKGRVKDKYRFIVTVVHITGEHHDTLDEYYDSRAEAEKVGRQKCIDWAKENEVDPDEVDFTLTMERVKDEDV